MTEPDTAVAQPAAAPVPPPLDFKKIEGLRRHMMITQDQMAKLLSVSRVSYLGWVGGKPIRTSNANRVRTVLRKLLVILRDNEWPTPHVIAMSSEQRFKTLLEALGEAG